MNVIDWFKRAENADLRVKNFINGQYVDCQGNSCITKCSPRDGKPIYEFPVGRANEIDDAVDCARKTFDEGVWRKQSVHQRKAVLQNLKALIEKNAEELALLDCIDVGKPISKALNADIPMTLNCLSSYIENMDKLLSQCGLDGSDFAYRLRKPVGVVGGIIGWNYPLLMAILKMGPALAMGNSLVLKPSELSPLSANRLGSLVTEAGVPPGVFNIVNGAGNTVGSALANHRSVDLVSFTGSTSTGKKMMIAAGQTNMKRLILECGGKSPVIIFDDCPEDLDFIASAIVDTAFRNQGQLCVSGSRLLLSTQIKEKLLPKIIEVASQLKPMDPLNSDSNFGPLVSESQLDKVLNFIDKGKKDGAHLLLGGKRINTRNDELNSKGYYIEPTIFDHVDQDSNLAQEEIFGPVLSVLTFESESEAIKMANNSRYGLAAYAATTDLSRAHRLARDLNCGGLEIVGSSSLLEGSVEMGTEPHKQSGFGSEVGVSGLISYSTSTAVHIFS